MTADRKPRRIQRRRSKGWRKPEGAVSVTRGTSWGNPAVVQRTGSEWEVVGASGYCVTTSRSDAHRYAVDQYRHMLNTGRLIVTADDARRLLRGKDLACWCPLDMPCHADVLLEIANDGTPL